MCICSPTTLAVLAIVIPHTGAITVEASRICDCVTVYQVSFTLQFSVLPMKTSMRELKQKLVVPTSESASLPAPGRH
jgi:hypothetical protein